MENNIFISGIKPKEKIQNKISNIHDYHDIGVCINNDSPYQRNYCDCYKYPIPYKLIDKSGVLFCCRGWINYCFGNCDGVTNDSRINNGLEFVRNAIRQKLLELYPHFNDERVNMNSGYSNAGGKLQGMNFWVTPRPFNIMISVHPSFFIEQIKYDECSTWQYSDYSLHSSECPNQLHNKLYRKMYDIVAQNNESIQHYVNSNNGRFIKYQKLIDDLITKINKQ